MSLFFAPARITHEENHRMNPQIASLPTTDLAQSTSRSGFGLKPVFVGPNGIRAGWRLLMFLAIFVSMMGTTRTILLLVLGRPKMPTALTPGAVALGEGLAFVFLTIAAVIMARIEHRKFSDYGLPLRLALRKDFWLGALWGFLSISGALLAIFALHGFRITGLAIHGTTILTATLAWTATCIVIGLCEESMFRGYPQFTLTTGMGFWPAAILLSATFAALHAFNPGETITGLLSVVVFGLLFCLFIRRRGNVWLAVGFHAGWDWGQTFFYGVHDSGLAPYHNLFASEFHGARWLTGGSVGPEASIFTPIALGIVALLFGLRHRQVRYQPEVPSERVSGEVLAVTAIA
jgi:membrane protease YdiL (CAAX protease family)